MAVQLHQQSTMPALESSGHVTVVREQKLLAHTEFIGTSMNH
jgi:hypothetical protein